MRSRTVSTPQHHLKGLFTQHFDLIIGYLALGIGILLGLPCFDSCREYECLACLITLYLTAGVGLVICTLLCIFGIIRQLTIPLEPSVTRWILLTLPFLLLVIAGVIAFSVFA